MTMPDVSGLPENNDATYADDPDNPSRKLHQQHHDTVHAAVKALLPRAEASATYAALPPAGGFVVYATEDQAVADANPQFVWLVLEPVAAGDTTAPTVPTNLAATPGDGQVSLSWTASTDAVGVTGYRVYRDGVLATSPTGTSTVVSSLTNGTQYSFTVAAIDAAGNLSAQSAAVLATPAAAAAATYDPTAYTSLQQWFKADAITPQADNTRIATWANSNGGTNNLITNFPEQEPLYRTANNAPNGKPYVQFDGSDRMNSQGSWSAAGASVSVLIVVRRDAGTNTALWGSGTGTGPTELYYDTADPTIMKFDKRGQVALGATSAVSPGTTWHVVTGIYTSGSNVSVWFDGTQVLNGSVTASSNASDALFLGARGDNADFASVSIAEVITYNKALPTSERQALEAGLKSKYGIA